MRYYLIGPYPPPIGGVSNYIQRYEAKLIEKGDDVKIIDFNKIPRLKQILWLLKIISYPRFSIFHLNYFDFQIMLAVLIRPFRKKIMFTDHNGRIFEYHLTPKKRILLTSFIKRVDEYRLVENHLIDYYKEYGFQLPDNVIIQNAFLPPPVEKQEDFIKKYDQEILEFISSHNPVIIANAFRIRFYKGEDLYGIDLCIELTSLLKKKFPSVGFLFAIAEIGEKDYYKKMKKNLEELNINSNFLFMTGQQEFWPLLSKADLMIRPTNTDGDAVSIREALFMNCPVVASDVVRRPEGTIVFKNRDVKDLFDNVVKTLNSIQK